MKYFTTKGFKFFFVNSRHNFFHWLVVVLNNAVRFTIVTLISAYLFAFGYSLARLTLESFLPPAQIAKISPWLYQLPDFDLLELWLLDQLGFTYPRAHVWWALVVGLPLILATVCFFLIHFFNLFHAIISLAYNRTHCPFCKKPIGLKANSRIA